MMPITPVPYLHRPPGAARRTPLANALALARVAAVLILGDAIRATTHRHPRPRRS
jgi:hypothetical protein